MNISYPQHYKEWYKGKTGFEMQNLKFVGFPIEIAVKKKRQKYTSRVKFRLIHYHQLCTLGYASTAVGHRFNLADVVTKPRKCSEM